MEDALHDPVLRNDWHPVAIAQGIVQGVITPTQLLDTALALWRDTHGQVHAWEDRCPHRGVKFSIGTQQGDVLRCAYHGWTFGAEGKCRHIPALPSLDEAQLKARATTFAVQERYGLIWVCLGTPKFDVPKFPEFGDDQLRKVWCGPYEVQSSGPRIVENFLDMAHFAFVHTDILGVQDQAEIADYEVQNLDDPEMGQGILATRCHAWQPQASNAALSGSTVEYSYRVLRPLTAILTKQSASGPRDAIALFVQPLTELTTRVWIILALGDFESSDAALRQFQDTIFLQDLPILENQNPLRLPLIAGAEVSVVCDRMSLAYRNYLKQMSLRYGVLSAACSTPGEA